jgi:hypothetical protein
METYVITLWLTRGTCEGYSETNVATFEIEVGPDDRLTEIARNKMPFWVEEYGWEIEHLVYVKLNK